MSKPNWIITLLRNNLNLSRRAIASFRAQDVEGGVKVFAINNGSTDGTAEWLMTQPDLVQVHFGGHGMSVAASWNFALDLAWSQGAEWVLVVNNDVELRPDTYRWLLADGGGFVTAVGSRDAECVKTRPTPRPDAVRPHPDFSCFLIRREVWNTVGPFDEAFEGAFCEDWDYHVRLHKAGVFAHCIDLPFLHHGSATINNAPRHEVRRLQQQADKNRAYFKQKWGVAGASEEYYALFGSTAPSAAGDDVVASVGVAGAVELDAAVSENPEMKAADDGQQ